jgi:hypothetical protein
MNHGRKLKLYAIGEVSFLITLALFSTSVAGSEPNVRITVLEVYEFPPFFYDIDLWIHNYEDYDVTVEEVEHTLIYPNGAEHKVMMGPYVIQANEDFGMSILCMYPSHLCGTYTWVVTLRDASGVVLDEKSVSWEREEAWEKIRVLF